MKPYCKRMIAKGHMGLFLCSLREGHEPGCVFMRRKT